MCGIVTTAVGLWFLRLEIKDSIHSVSHVSLSDEEKGRKKQLEHIYADSDNDGLKDWEEVLWKTDPANPDTDNDGMKDGEEITKNRNPAIPGPDDALPVTPINPESAPQTATAEVFDYLTKELAERYVNGTLSSDTTNVQQATASYITSATLGEVDLYTRQDLHVLENPAPEDIKRYVLETSAILQPVFKASFKSPFFGLGFIETNDEEEFAKKRDELLWPVIYIYDDAETALQQKEVPSSYVTVHLQTLNAIKKGKESIIAIRRMELDPVLGLVGTNQFARALQNLLSAIQDAQVKITQEGIVFSDDEMTLLRNNIKINWQ